MMIPKLPNNSFSFEKYVIPANVGQVATDKELPDTRLHSMGFGCPIKITPDILCFFQIGIRRIIRPEAKMQMIAIQDQPVKTKRLRQFYPHLTPGIRILSYCIHYIY
jgi:hypothetical protein